MVSILIVVILPAPLEPAKPKTSSALTETRPSMTLSATRSLLQQVKEKP